MLARSDGLHLVRGRWVELNRDALARMLDEFRAVERAAAGGGLSFAEAMRLADDMGLGKTMQVLALILVRRRQHEGERRTSLLVAPASLLANWASEIARFAPSLRTLVAHPSAMPATELRTLDQQRLGDVDLVITSYGSLLRIPGLVKIPWHLTVLDEAQAIKNPGARQTRAPKQLDAHARIALTGTPVENRLGDRWSIFDFIIPGLLGSTREFASFTRRLADRPHNPYAPLRELVRPYILRRLKTDKTVIADLPDKTEVKAYCHLTRTQAALYQQAVKELAAALNTTQQGADGIARRGVVLAFLMRFKQICNHPSHPRVVAEPGAGAAVSAGRRRAVLRPLAQGWRHRSTSPPRRT